MNRFHCCPNTSPPFWRQDQRLCSYSFPQLCSCFWKYACMQSIDIFFEHNPNHESITAPVLFPPNVGAFHIWMVLKSCSRVMLDPTIRRATPHAETILWTISAKMFLSQCLLAAGHLSVLWLLLWANFRAFGWENMGALQRASAEALLARET